MVVLGRAVVLTGTRAGRLCSLLHETPAGDRPSGWHVLVDGDTSRSWYETNELEVLPYRLTEWQVQALIELRRQTDEDRFATPRSFAGGMWPNSPAWGKRTRGYDRHPGAVGGTMPMRGARELWKLRELRLAWVEEYTHWTVSPAGRKLLDRLAALRG